MQHALLLAGDLNCLAWPQDCAAFAVAPYAKQARLFHLYYGLAYGSTSANLKDFFLFVRCVMSPGFD
jgi:hypothetical protein